MQRHQMTKNDSKLDNPVWYLVKETHLRFQLNQIFGENKMPYLHVTDTNAAAINLYEKIGFKTRRKISFWNFIKTE